MFVKSVSFGVNGRSPITLMRTIGLTTCDRFQVGTFVWISVVQVRTRQLRKDVW